MLTRIARRGLVSCLTSRPVPHPIASVSIRCASSSSRSTSSKNDLADRPFRVGIVGGGPAGFYAASRLLGLPGSEQVKVDLFELLPTPFGLARFGVAPDHPEVKNCEHKFEETARDPRFRYFGNVQVCGASSATTTTTTTNSPSSSTAVPNLSPSSLAVQLPLSTLREHYDAVLLTYGASLDRPLGIPGEFESSNVLSARSFVNWYNGHPHHSSLLSPLIDLSQTRHVTIVGQGNVALDVARILLKPIDELREFDVPDYCLAELSRSRVERVEVVGRRGVLQLAATTKELREMMNLDGVGFDGIEPGMLRDAKSQVGDMGQEGRAKKRALGLIEKGCVSPREQSEKSWSLDFLKSPRQLLPQGFDATSTLPSTSVSFDTLSLPPQKVGAVLYDLNELVPPENSDEVCDPSRYTARPSGQTQIVSTDLVFKSVGYRSIGLPGLPFDERKGVVKNREGRVVDDQGEIMEGLYTSGWLARGPNGVIATTMFNAFSTADLIAQDLATRTTYRSNDRGAEDIDRTIELCRGNKKVVSWQEWETIDRIEKDRGRAKGKIREKMTSVEEMLRVLS